MITPVVQLLLVYCWCAYVSIAVICLYFSPCLFTFSCSFLLVVQTVSKQQDENGQHGPAAVFG